MSSSPFFFPVSVTPGTDRPPVLGRALWAVSPTPPTVSSGELPLRPPSVGTVSAVGLFGSGGKSVSLKPSVVSFGRGTWWGFPGSILWLEGGLFDLAFWGLVFFVIVGDNGGQWEAIGYYESDSSKGVVIEDGGTVLKEMV